MFSAYFRKPPNAVGDIEIEETSTVSFAWNEELKETPSRPGALLGIQIGADLLARLDKARGGMTRPQEIRKILEKELPK